MDTCTKCKLKFPEYLVTDMAVSDRRGLQYIRVCPICALQISNKVHGINRTEFGGEHANDMLRQARQFIGMEKVQ